MLWVCTCVAIDVGSLLVVALIVGGFCAGAVFGVYGCVAGCVMIGFAVDGCGYFQVLAAGFCRY